MKYFFFFISFLISTNSFSQVVDSLKTDYSQDSIIYSIELNEIIVTKDGVYDEILNAERKKLQILRRRVFKVYPYAKLTSEKLLYINETLAKLKTEKEKKKFLKIAENFLQEEFEPRLKKLSRKDGQILVKLIHRQTGTSTFDLIKEYKSGWKAFWSNSTARVFDINLKEEYKPFDEIEDFYIESILVEAFNEGSLQIQPTTKQISLSELVQSWKDKKNAAN
jgi:hypothetical protein